MVLHTPIAQHYIHTYTDVAEKSLFIFRPVHGVKHHQDATEWWKVPLKIDRQSCRCTTYAYALFLYATTLNIDPKLFIAARPLPDFKIQELIKDLTKQKSYESS